jgi:ABC-type multidrug transport system fused ATPase/permease subunit
MPQCHAAARACAQTNTTLIVQDASLCSASVADNIAFGVAASQADVQAAAQAAGAHGFITALPQGYDTCVSDASLSGGQRQRLSIARALLRRPQLLILDEATSALDAESDAAFQRTLDKVQAERSLIVVVIAHRLATVQRCSRIVVLDAGVVVEQGTHSELLAAGGSYAKLVEQQALMGSSQAQT